MIVIGEAPSPNATRAVQLFVRHVAPVGEEHCFRYFAQNAANGVVLPFLTGLVRAVSVVDAECPGYADEMFRRIAAIKGLAPEKYDALLGMLAEIYVTAGALRAADWAAGKAQFAREPGARGAKNPECEVSVRGRWVAVEVKAPALSAHRKRRSRNPWQFVSRLPSGALAKEPVTLPRDNPVKDFLVSAEAKFAEYETYRSGALRLLFIVWDDFCNEPISALLSEASGLLTPNSFHRDGAGNAVTYPHVDGIVVIRQQHQFVRAAGEKSLSDGVSDAMAYRHDGFPPKAFFAVPGGRPVPPEVLEALNLTEHGHCLGGEYIPGEIVMWIG
jgi:hypothetical protein